MGAVSEIKMGRCGMKTVEGIIEYKGEEYDYAAVLQASAGTTCPSG
jgi:hypothetical protein